MKINLGIFRNISVNSSTVVSGDLFVAIKGTQFNGEDFVEEALNAGARAAIVSEKYHNDRIDRERLIKVKNPRQTLAKLAAELYEKQPENIVAVTGTNGKTSVVNFFRDLLKFSGATSASIGTLGIIADGIGNSNGDSMTSPDPLTLHSQLALLYDRGVTHLGIEASSHGLNQYRLDGVNFKAAGFTNFTHDHLDYHGSMQEYFSAKVRLFTDLLPAGATAVLNADTEQFSILEAICKRKKINVISYGKHAKHLKLLEAGKTIEIDAFGNKYSEQFNLVGNFQYYNVLCAVGLAVAVGMPVEKAIVYIPLLRAACGRLEHVTTFNDAEVFIDYAHTPDALAKALFSLRPLCKGKLYVIFGAAGSRDPLKRPEMGKIAAQYADCAIITDDNPRTENPAAIRKEILAHCPNGIEYEDRTSSIQETMTSLKPGDILLIAGKGHETYQVIGTTKIHYSDHEVVRNMKPNL